MGVKHLYLLRHAKSSWKDSSLSDYERPLNKRGSANAPMMAQRFKKKHCKLDVIITSGALRAQTTASVFADILSCHNLHVNDSIYGASLLELLNLLHVNFKRYDHVMIVGHNPDLTELSNYLSNHYIENIPTCGMVALKFDAKKIRKHSLQLQFFDYPKK